MFDGSLGSSLCRSIVPTFAIPSFRCPSTSRVFSFYFFLCTFLHSHSHFFFLLNPQFVLVFMCHSCYSLLVCLPASLLAPHSAPLSPDPLLSSFHQHFSLIIEATFLLPHATFIRTAVWVGQVATLLLLGLHHVTVTTTILLVVVAGIAQNLGYSNPTKLYKKL